MVFPLMTDTPQIARRISSLCGGLWLPRYTSCKIKTDPLYGGIFAELEGRDLPLLDIGCGLGILAMYLRERDWGNPVTGIDYDASKIKGGQRMLAKGGYEGISLAQGDARTGLPEHQGDVSILDIMQFFDGEEQLDLLKAAASRVAPGGRLLIRSGLLEKNARFFCTWAGDIFARCTFWMRAAPIHYPTRDFFRETLGAEGFSVEVRPFWGNTPFNNYLIVAKRPE
jgi:2-polyprenyl-3-methyl-5-hydroxy-6-metoxy-1,4-benzoquinol methylase